MPAACAATRVKPQDSHFAQPFALRLKLGVKVVSAPVCLKQEVQDRSDDNADLAEMIGNLHFQLAVI